jgi:nucleotide-binding universal stress UspA family protein
MIKDIIVNLAVAPYRTAATDFAISVAETFQAHLAGFAYVYEPVLPGSIFDSVTTGIVEAQLAEAKKNASAAVTNFENAARRAAISAEAHMFQETLVGAAQKFGLLARRFDLSIVPQAESDRPGPASLMIETALFETGRPVLVVPYIQKGGLQLDKVLVCWDGSRNSARAIADAMPFLTRAKKVEVLIVAGEQGKYDQIPGADIAHHLARHNLKVDLKRVVNTTIDVPNTILSHAADSSADLIVMGGYGHSRLREFILGGATEGILATMTVPTLMSH